MTRVDCHDSFIHKHSLEIEPESFYNSSFDSRIHYQFTIYFLNFLRIYDLFREFTIFFFYQIICIDYYMLDPDKMSR